MPHPRTGKKERRWCFKGQFQPKVEFFGFFPSCAFKLTSQLPLILVQFWQRWRMFSVDQCFQSNPSSEHLTVKVRYVFIHYSVHGCYRPLLCRQVCFFPFCETFMLIRKFNSHQSLFLMNYPFTLLCINHENLRLKRLSELSF